MEIFMTALITTLVLINIYNTVVIFRKFNSRSNEPIYNFKQYSIPTRIFLSIWLIMAGVGFITALFLYGIKCAIGEVNSKEVVNKSPKSKMVIQQIPTTPIVTPRPPNVNSSVLKPTEKSNNFIEM